MKSLLEPELNQLRDQILIMGGEVENAIERAMRALEQRLLAEGQAVATGAPSG